MHILTVTPKSSELDRNPVGMTTNHDMSKTVRPAFYSSKQFVRERPSNELAIALLERHRTVSASRSRR